MLRQLAVERVVLLLQVVDLVFKKLLNLCLVRCWHCILRVVDKVLDCLVDALGAILVASADLCMVSLVACHLGDELLRHVAHVL